MAVADAQKELPVMEAMSSLKIEDGPKGQEFLDRDSANHSPLDYVLTHPNSDARSEGSNDSGKGGSDYVTASGEDYLYCDMMTPPTSPPVMLMPVPMDGMLVYEFEVPQGMCGLLIGKNGNMVHSIRAQSGANLVIRKNRSNKRMKICSVEGTREQIDEALSLIRSKFPLKTYPGLTLAQVNAPEASLYVLPDNIQLQLTPGLENSVVVSTLVAAHHVFLQNINNPTFPLLANLDLCMAQCYNEFETPALPRPVQPNLVCAAPLDGGWYRAKVVEIHSDQTDSEDYEVDICFVDYGGYARVPVSSLRQIRADLISLPFQGIECLLANISPPGDDDWSPEACAVVEELTKDQILQAELIGFTLEGLPLVHLYQVTPEGSLLLINRELVARGLAVWVEPDVVQEVTDVDSHV